MTKVLIVGGGVVGCALAREMARFDCEIVVLEKSIDVSEGTSKANSGIVHAGFDAKPGTQKAKFNVLGNAMFDRLAEELDFPFKRNGAFVTCFKEDDFDGLKKLFDQGTLNGVKDLQLLTGDQAREKEPNLSKEVAYALFAPQSGIVSPYEMTLAYAQNAEKNGVKFEFGCKVDGVDEVENGFEVRCGDKSFFGNVVVNCAGVYADEINDMVSGKPQFSITPRKGEYMILDKDCGDVVERTIFRLPTKMGKGVLVTKTTHGCVLVGPTSVDVTDKEDVKTTPEGLEMLWQKGILLIPSLDKNLKITQFAGNRAHGSLGDFVIGWAQKGFFNLGAIESPGLTSAPALAVFTAEEIAKEYGLAQNPNFDPIRKDIPHIANLSEQDRQKLTEENPQYGNIVCQCEYVSEGEIRECIRRPLGAKTLDGVKRRTRAGMGRCQRCRCYSQIVRILSEELGVDPSEVV